MVDDTPEAPKISSHLDRDNLLARPALELALYLIGDFRTDLIVDFNAERMTERIIDFIADAPFLLDMALLMISFNFLSPNLSREAVAKVMSCLVAILEVVPFKFSYV
jgi:hypothetical protein